MFQIHESLRSPSGHIDHVALVGVKVEPRSQTDDDQRRGREVERGAGLADGRNDCQGRDDS